MTADKNNNVSRLAPTPFPLQTTSTKGFDAGDPAVRDFERDLREQGMSDHEATQLLDTLWQIMAAMVDLGFRVDLVDPCGQIFEPFNEAAACGDAELDSSHPNLTEMPSHGTEKDRNATR